MLSAFVVTAAAALFESAPFVLAGVLLSQQLLRRAAWTAPYAGCGCGRGPSARSLPAAALTCMLFGPLPSLVRFFAAVAAARLTRAHACADSTPDSALEQLHAVLPIAAFGGAFSFFAPALFGAHLRGATALAAGAAVAFFMSPCGIGSAGFAAALRPVSAAAAFGFLCVAGIADARVWLARKRNTGGAHDVFAYVLVAASCAIAAARHGAGLVHPLLAALLWICSAACAALGWQHRTRANARLRFAPAVMLAGCILVAPPPAYSATETTLADAFPGEAIAFTGTIVRSAHAAALVRYAITCCRADAAPIVVRLDRAPPHLRGWVRASGTLELERNAIVLRTRRLERVAPPFDPFVYR